MSTLMELTKQVTYKMKLDTTVHNSPKFHVNKADTGGQLHDLDLEIYENYEEVKRLKEEKTNIDMKFEVNQKDHSRYVTVKNEIADSERQLKTLDKYHTQLVKMIEGTRDIIQKKTEDSGKE